MLRTQTEGAREKPIRAFFVMFFFIHLRFFFYFIGKRLRLAVTHAQLFALSIPAYQLRFISNNFETVFFFL